MQRRNFLWLLGAELFLSSTMVRAEQTTTIPTVGVLWHAGRAEEESDYLPVLRKAFHDLGYVEGKNIKLEHRFPAEQPERFRTLAKEFVESKVAVIVAVTAQGAVAAKQFTTAFRL